MESEECFYINSPLGTSRGWMGGDHAGESRLYLMNREELKVVRQDHGILNMFNRIEKGKEMMEAVVKRI